MDMRVTGLVVLAGSGAHAICGAGSKEFGAGLIRSGPTGMGVHSPVVRDVVRQWSVRSSRILFRRW